MKKIRVLICDDHPVFREGLSLFLDKEEDIEIIAKAASGEEGVELSKELLPDVVMMDTIRFGIGGFEAAMQIKNACPNTAVLMMGVYTHEANVEASFKVNASGYLSKSADALYGFADAIRLVHKGIAVFDLGIIRACQRHSADGGKKEADGVKTLQRRELEVLRLMVKGLSNKEIATDLVISESTVQSHLSNIYGKLNVNSRMEAAFHALKEHLVSIEDL